MRTVINWVVASFSFGLAVTCNSATNAFVLSCVDTGSNAVVCCIRNASDRPAKYFPYDVGHSITVERFDTGTGLWLPLPRSATLPPWGMVSTNAVRVVGPGELAFPAWWQPDWRGREFYPRSSFTVFLRDYVLPSDYIHPEDFLLRVRQSLGRWTSLGLDLVDWKQDLVSEPFKYEPNHTLELTVPAARSR